MLQDNIINLIYPAKAKLEYNNDKSEAYLTLLPPPDKGKIKMGEIIDFLTKHNLLVIDKEALRQVIEKRQFNKKILIASGFPSTKGEPAYLLYQFGIGRELKAIKGQILVVKVPPTFGQSGITIFGDIIPPVLGDDFEITAGKNVAISKDGTKAFSLTSGIVRWEKNTVTVKETNISDISNIYMMSNNKESMIDIETLPLSVVVTANSPNEAKRIGSQIFALDTEMLDVKIEGEFFRVFESGTIGPWDKEFESLSTAFITNKDGEFEILNTDTGCYLLVSPSQGDGKRIELSEVIFYLQQNGFKGFNENIIRDVIQKSTGYPVKICERQKNPEIDGYVTVEIAGDYSKASITVIPPKAGGCSVTLADVMDTLRENNVVSGINKEAILDALDKKSSKAIVAESIPPQKGEPARIEYNFRTNRDTLELEEDEYGRIDFKKLNLIENVPKGKILVTKIPACKGKPGKLVNGNEIPGLEGEDVKFLYGKNTEISQDGLKVIATTNGQVLLGQDKKVHVEDTITINGDICLETGHIYFLGSVIIKGSVLDTFDVEAAGDIEVHGTVGKCFISAGGSIAIGEGVKGKNGARLFASGDIIAKYIEGARVDTKSSVRVTQEIMHSNVSANKNVSLEGKMRSCIIGGLTRAGHEVTAKEIGAPAGTRTIIEVGGEPKVRQELANLNSLYESDLERRQRIEKDLQIIMAKKKINAKLPVEDMLKYNKLNKILDKLTIRLDRYLYKRDFLESKILISTEGAVNVSETLFAGVVIVIRTARLEVKKSYQTVSFIFENNQVRMCPYSPHRESA